MSIGPSRPLALEKPETIDLKQAARYFGQRGEPDAATASLLERCAVPILAAAAPHAVWLESDVKSLAEAGLLQGEDVYRHLTGCDRAILLAVTLGPGVDAQIRRAGVGDIAAGGPGWGTSRRAWRRMRWVPRWQSRWPMLPKPNCAMRQRGRATI